MVHHPKNKQLLLLAHSPLLHHFPWCVWARIPPARRRRKHARPDDATTTPIALILKNSLVVGNGLPKRRLKGKRASQDKYCFPKKYEQSIYLCLIHTVNYPSL
jgi:hypothetical protein